MMKSLYIQKMVEDIEKRFPISPNVREALLKVDREE